MKTWLTKMRLSAFYHAYRCICLLAACDSWSESYTLNLCVIVNCLALQKLFNNKDLRNIMEVFIIIATDRQSLHFNDIF